MVIPENKYMSKIIQTEQVIFRNIYICTYTYKHVTINDGKVINLKESKEGRIYARVWTEGG